LSKRITLIAAIALGLLAAVINWSYMASIRGSGLTVLRVKDGKAIKAGQLVSADMFEPVTIYGDLGKLRNLVVTTAELPAYKSQPVVEPLQTGDLLLLSAFRLQGDSGVRQEVGPGERALTVQVGDESRAVGYFIRPGDVVDVWANINGQAYMLKDHARVAAVGEVYQLASEGGQGPKGADRKFRSVTLVTSAKDIEALVHNIGLAGGRVTLALVGGDDANTPAGPALEPITTLARGAAEPAAAARTTAAQPTATVPR
jgi:Flp pilus assembly protein CpaB